MTSTGSYSVADYLPPQTVPLTVATSVATSADSSYTGSVALLNGIADVTPALTGTGETERLSFGMLAVNLPEFSIDTSYGKITVESGVYDPVGNSLSISSGSLTPTASGSSPVSVTMGSFAVDPASNLARLPTVPEFLDKLEDELLLGRSLPFAARSRMETFLTTSETGTPVTFAPYDANYQKKKIRAVISMVLSQPEYVLQTGYDVASETSMGGISPISSAEGKLVIVEL